MNCQIHAPIYRLARSALLVLAATVVSSSSCSPSACLAAEPALKVQILHHTQDTDAAVANVEKGLSTIPTSIQQKISQAGISVVLTPFMVYDEPEESGKRVFREGGTTENIGGQFQPGKQRVIIPERCSYGSGTPRPQGQYLIVVLRHELGHAWDHAMGNVSQKEPYIAAYNEDFVKLTNEHCRSLSYFITGVATSEAAKPTTSGHAEMFAGLFESLCTPRSQWKHKQTELRACFPHLTAYMQSLDTDLHDAPDGAGKSAPVEERPLSATDAQNSEQDVDLAEKFFQAKRYTEAIPHLDHAIRLNPKNGRALMLRGTTFIWLRDYRRSVQDYSNYLELHPDDANAYAYRARAYGWLGLKSRQDADEAKARQLGGK